MRSNFLFFKNIPSKHFSIKNAIEIDYLTRIRIWKSGYFIETADSQKQYMYTTNTAKSFLSPMTKGCQAKIGHVSIETKEIYASLRSNELSKPKHALH